jgi:aminoglycoside 3-N-acetyltransferase
METRSLVTRSSLVKDLRRAGIRSGEIILVHTSLSQLGFVVGAAETVIEALLEVTGTSGTVMMPTFSGELSDPVEWRYPPVPPDWIETIRAETPPYDPARTPTRRMGVVPELFRHRPGVLRSPHPQSSFTAIGKASRELVAIHPLDNRFGPNSPLGKLCQFDGKAILLGAPPQACSLYHLSQHYVPGGRRVVKRAPLVRDGRKEWVAYDDFDHDVEWFGAVTEELVQQGIVSKTKVGDAECLVLPARATTEAVIQWRKANRI